MIKTGIFGGTFDPVHNGHTALAKAALRELKLNNLLIVPAADPPHKSGERTPFSDRFEMCRLAFDGEEKISICDIEKKLGGKSYTINTVRALKQISSADTELYLIIGSDQLFSLDTWYKYESILKECHVCAAARNDDDYADMLERANELGRVRVMNLPVNAVSSTQIRQSFAAGESIGSLVPPAVAAYIAERGLYRGRA